MVNGLRLTGKGILRSVQRARIRALGRLAYWLHPEWRLLHCVDDLAHDRPILSRLSCQVALCSIVSFTSGPIRRAQTAKNVAG